MKKGLLILLTCVLLIGMVSPAWAENAQAGITAKALAKPAALKAVAQADGKSIQLAWTMAAGDGATYEVQRKSGSKWKSLSTVSEAGYTDSKLKVNTKYSYRVRTISGKEKSAFSTASAKTKNPVTSLAIKKTATVYMGTPLTLKATIKPKKATDKALTWSSADTAVAKVKNGKITPVAVGKTTITVSTANGKSASCTVTVKLPNPKSVSLSKTKATIYVGNTLTLKPTVKPASADKAITWKSSNTKIATVSKDGVVTALKAGTAKITATTVNGKKKICTVTVKQHVSMGKNDLKLYINGKLFTLPATYAAAKKFKPAGFDRDYFGYAAIFESDEADLDVKYTTSGKKLVRAAYHGGGFRTYRGVGYGDSPEKLLSVYGMPDLYHESEGYDDDRMYYTFIYKFKAGSTYYMTFTFDDVDGEIYAFGVFTKSELDYYLFADDDDY